MGRASPDGGRPRRLYRSARLPGGEAEARTARGWVTAAADTRIVAELARAFSFPLAPSGGALARPQGARTKDVRLWDAAPRVRRVAGLALTGDGMGRPPAGRCLVYASFCPFTALANACECGWRSMRRGAPSHSSWRLTKRVHRAELLQRRHHLCRRGRPAAVAAPGRYRTIRRGRLGSPVVRRRIICKGLHIVARGFGSSPPPCTCRALPPFLSPPHPPPLSPPASPFPLSLAPLAPTPPCALGQQG